MTTLLDLRSRAYALMDEGQSQYLGVAEMNNYINNAASVFHNIVVTESPWRAQQEQAYSIITGVSDYMLPADFRDALKLFAVASGNYIPLKRFNPSEFGRPTPYMFSTLLSCDGLPRYNIMGGKIRLSPVPSVTAGYTLLLWYAPSYTPLVADTDTLPSFFINGHDQWIVNSTVIYAKAKEEVGSQDFQLMNQQIMQQILLDLRQRDRGAGSRIIPEEDAGMSPWR